MSGANVLLEVDNLAKTYGEVNALAGVSFQLSPGEVVGLLGPNGAGKTSLLSVICGLRHADSGRVVVGGFDVRAYPHRVRELIGLSPQDAALYPSMTVHEHLAFFGGLAGLTRREIGRRVDSIAGGLLISELMDRRISGLSGGERKRVSAAIAILHRPALLILDEVTAGADVETRHALIELVRDLAADGTGVIFATHYLPEVEAINDRVVVLERGLIVADGTVTDLIASRVDGVVQVRYSEGTPILMGSDIEGLLSHPPVIDGSSVTLTSPDPTNLVKRLLTSLGDGCDAIEAIYLTRPSLEEAFLTLTSTSAGGTS